MFLFCDLVKVVLHILKDLLNTTQESIEPAYLYAILPVQQIDFASKISLVLLYSVYTSVMVQ